MKKLIVVGKSEYSGKPDWVTVHMSLKTEDKDSKKALSTAKNQLANITQEFKTLDLDVITSNFNAGSVYQHAKIRITNKYEKVFQSFKVEYSCFVELPFESKQILDVLSLLENAKPRPDFRFTFSIKDTQPILDRLSADAVMDAKRQANILADAAGVKLIGIAEINNAGSSFHDSYDMYEREMIRPEMAVEDLFVSTQLEEIYGDENSLESMFLLNPKDIKLNDEVRVIFEIGEK